MKTILVVNMPGVRDGTRFPGYSGDTALWFVTVNASTAQMKFAGCEFYDVVFAGPTDKAAQTVLRHYIRRPQQ